MNIGLIGSGGREHALCKKIHESSIVKKIICFPGNAGTSEIATNVDVDIHNFRKILKLIKNNKIDLVIVGPEEPLVRGIVDFLKKIKLKFLVQISMQKIRGIKSFHERICQKIISLQQSLKYEQNPCIKL